MKHLILMRHASAEPGGVDRGRALSQAGRGEAERIGRALAAMGLRPDLALVSPALRACETLRAVRETLVDVASSEEDEALYLAGPAELLARL